MIDAARRLLSKIMGDSKLGHPHDHAHDDHAHDHGDHGHDHPHPHDHGHGDHGHDHAKGGAHHHDHGPGADHQHHYGPLPEEIRMSREDNLIEIDFDDGESYRYSAEYLRVHSPSAEVMGHGPGQQITVACKKDVSVVSLEPVGNYAIRIIFGDGHDTGIFSWGYLHELGEREEHLWQLYLDTLQAKGLKREA